MPSPPVDPLPRLLAEEPFVRALARALLVDDPDEVVQQTFLLALRARPAELQEPRSWLARVVRNVASNLRRSDRRRGQRERAVAVPELVPSSAELMLREEQRRLLVQAVDELPSPLRTVVLLRWFEGLPPRRIAKLLGLPVTTVSNQLRSALGRLRERLDAEHGGDRRAWALPLALFGAGNAAPLAPVAPAAGTELAGPWTGVGTGLVAGGTVMTIQAKTAAAVGIALVLALAFVCWPDGSPASQGAPAAGREPLAAVAAPVEAAKPRADAVPSTNERHAIAAEPAAATGSLLVRVRYADDTPAAGITAIVSAPGADFRIGRRRAVCDAEGMARFDGLAPGSVRAFTDRPYSPSVTAEIVAGRTVEAVCKLKAGVTITGSVVDAQQQPVPSALVELTRPAASDLDIETVARTGPDGRFVVRAGPEVGVIGARAAGFAASRLQSLMGKDGNEAEVRIQLTALGGTVDGRVEDTAGTPVVGAIVRVGRGLITRIAADNEGAPPAAALVRTDDAGRFHAVGIEPGDQPVEVRALGFAPWRGNVAVAVGLATPTRTVLVPGGIVHGRVRDASGNPMTKAQVEVGQSRDFAYFRARPAPDGTFALTSLPVGEVEIRARADDAGKAKATVLLVGGEVVPCELVLATGRELRGRVVDELGEPVIQATVTAFAEGARGGESWRGFAETRADGTFTIANAPDGGTFWVDVRGVEIASLRQEGVAWAAETVLRVRRLGKPSARIEGIVHGRDGKPMANVSVVAWREDPRDSSGIVATGGDGRFEIGPLHAGRWQVRAQGLGYPEARTEWHELQTGATWDVGVIGLRAGGAVVVVPSGDAKLVAAAADGYRVFRGVEYLYDMSTQDRLRSQALEPGDYHLWLSGDGVARRLIPFTIRPGEDTRVSVALQAGIRQRIVLAPPAGSQAPRDGKCVLHRGTELAATAHPRGAKGEPVAAETWLVPGSYSLTATLGDLRGAATFTVGDREGEPLVVPLRMP